MQATSCLLLLLSPGIGSSFSTTSTTSKASAFIPTGGSVISTPWAAGMRRHWSCAGRLLLPAPATSRAQSALGVLSSVAAANPSSQAAAAAAAAGGGAAGDRRQSRAPLFRGGLAGSMSMSTANPSSRWTLRGDYVDIKSTSNPRVAFFRSLHKRKVRDAEGLVLIEGRRLVKDAIDAGYLPEMVLVSPEALHAPGSGLELRLLLQSLPEESVMVASADVVARCCDTVSPQGVVAACPRGAAGLPKVINTLLVCDGIQDPGNLGTLIRSAAALGVDAVLLSGACADLWGPKTLRATMGAAFRIPSLAVRDWDQAREELQELNLKVYAAETSAPVPYYNVDWAGPPSALIVGSEASGLGPGAAADVLEGRVTGVSIPQTEGAESLNAAVAGTIVLAEAQRQRILQGERGEEGGL